MIKLVTVARQTYRLLILTENCYYHLIIRVFSKAKPHDLSGLYFTKSLKSLLMRNSFTYIEMTKRYPYNRSPNHLSTFERKQRLCIQDVGNLTGILRPRGWIEILPTETIQPGWTKMAIDELLLAATNSGSVMLFYHNIWLLCVCKTY